MTIIFVYIVFCVIGAAKCSKIGNDFFDFDNMEHVMQDHIRSERSPDYGAGLGGPIAAKHGPVAPPGRLPMLAPVSDQCKNSNSGSSSNAPKPKCQYVSMKNKILAAIRDGQPVPPDYQLLKTVKCTTDDECQEQCENEGGNYYVRSSADPTANVYLINEDKLLDSANHVHSDEHNSAILICQKAHDQHIRAKRSICGVFISECNCCWQNPINYCGAAPPPPAPAPPSCCPNVCASAANKVGWVAPVVAVAVAVPVVLGASAAAGAGGLGGGSGGAAGGSSGGAAAGQAAGIGAMHGPSPAAQQSFNQFQQQSGNNYDTQQQQQQAQQNFQQNQQQMNQNNQACKGDDAVQEPTKFSDMPFATFAAYYLGGMTGTISATPVSLSDSELRRPNDQMSLAWTESHVHGSLPPIRFQGQCGSCYAFSSADLITSQYNIERGLYSRQSKQADALSVQYIVDCGNKDAAFGCVGGRPVMVLKQMQESEGIPYESCYRYNEKAGSCNTEAAKKCCNRMKVKWSQLIDANGAKEKEIVAKLLNWGPMVAIVGANDYWQFYNGTGIIKAKQCDPKAQNHAVMVVGYNYTEDHTPYYWIRNSWGPDWGIGGYVKLEAGTNACNVAKSLLITCTGDCRDVNHVRDLVNRGNYPSETNKLQRPSKFHKGSSEKRITRPEHKPTKSITRWTLKPITVTNNANIQQPVDNTQHRLFGRLFKGGSG